MLAEKYGVAADVWSVTSYKALYREGIDAERWNRLHPGGEAARAVRDATAGGCAGRARRGHGLPEDDAEHDRAVVPRPLASLGTDGFGRSEGRAALRDFFEVDSRFVVLATLCELRDAGKIDRGVVEQAIADLQINPAKPNPVTV